MDRLIVGRTDAASTPPTLSLLPTATQQNPKKPYEHSDPKKVFFAISYGAYGTSDINHVFHSEAEMKWRK